jgi:hypothetical protein
MVQTVASAFEARADLPAPPPTLYATVQASNCVGARELTPVDYAVNFDGSELTALTKMPGVGQRQLMSQNHGIAATCLGREALHRGSIVVAWL